MKRWYDITLRTLRSIESWTWLYQGRNRWIHYVNLPIGHFPPTLLNISKSSRKSGPWTWLQSESASRIDVFQEFSNFKRIPVFALQTYIARIDRGPRFSFYALCDDLWRFESWEMFCCVGEWMLELLACSVAWTSWNKKTDLFLYILHFCSGHRFDCATRPEPAASEER